MGLQVPEMFFVNSTEDSLQLMSRQTGYVRGEQPNIWYSVLTYQASLVLFLCPRSEERLSNNYPIRQSGIELYTCRMVGGRANHYATISCNNIVIKSFKISHLHSLYVHTLRYNLTKIAKFSHLNLMSL